MLENSGSYGLYQPGGNNLLLVAPHGADEAEKNTAGLVQVMAAATGSWTIINQRVRREVCDLNNIRSIAECQTAAAHVFFSDLFSTAAVLQAGCSFSYVIFVHSCPRVFCRSKKVLESPVGRHQARKRQGDKRDWDIDFGCGVAAESCQAELSRARPGSFAAASQFRRSSRVTCAPNTIKKICELFRWNGLCAAIGREWPAMAKNNMVQAVAREYSGRRQVEVFQIEICDDVISLARVIDAFYAMIELLSAVNEPIEN